MCREKLGLPSARNNSIIISNQQTNKSKESCENDIILPTSEDDILLHDIIKLEDLEDFISTEIEACENNSIGIEVNLYIHLSNNNKINNDTNYNSSDNNINNNDNISLTFQKVIESIQIADDHTVLNPKRIHTKQEHFTCYGLLRLIFNPENMIMHLHLHHHELHPRPATKENVNENITTFIKNNIHLTSRQLWKHLQHQSHTLTQKQVHFWWSTFHQKLFYCDNDQFTSAIYLLQEDESYPLLYSNQENGLSEFAFTTPFLQLLHGIYDEICMDATYKTNNVGFELYTIMANIE
ncbi:10881_t:CDS:2, partial [Ambispora gerdemannii]